MSSKTIAILILLAAMSALSEAVPLPGSQKVEKLFNQADLVVLGQVKKVTIVSSQFDAITRSYTLQNQALIKVKRFYKNETGSNLVDLRFVTHNPETSARFPTVQAGSEYVLFLRKRGGTAYFSTPFFGVYEGSFRLHAGIADGGLKQLMLDAANSSMGAVRT